MMPATKPRRTRKRRPRGSTRFPGITSDAKALGVNRVTLWRVLTGKWTHLPGLARRYLNLKASKREAAK